MARPRNDSAAQGGYFVIHAKAFLENPTLTQYGMHGAFAKLLALAQLVDWRSGTFQVADIPLTPAQIEARAGLEDGAVECLIRLDQLHRLKNGLIFIKNWDRFQSPQTRSRFKNESLNESLNELTTSPEAVISNQESGIRQPLGRDDTLVGRQNTPKGGMDEAQKQRLKISREIEDLYHFLDKPNLSDTQRAQAKTKIMLLEEQLPDVGPPTSAAEA